MTKVINDRVAKTLKIFRRRKVLTVFDLASLMQCSLITVRRKLKQWNAYTSYNQNGRYYVLPDVPQFDGNGLWRYRDVCFSQSGNLTQTVIHLVKNSPAGFAASEIEELLHIQPRSFLSLFREHPALTRKQFHRRYVYVAADATVNRKQIEQRGKMTLHSHLPSDSEAIAILVETVKYPELTVEKLCDQLKIKKYDVSPEAVRNFFAYHGLPIKKTPDLP